jgi:glycine/D-amino acid oxidase-like deaminating enzyme
VPLSYKLHADLAREHGGKERWGYREVNCGQLIAEGQPLGYGKKSSAITEEAGEAVSLEKQSREAVGAPKAAGIPEDLDWFNPESLRSYEEMGSRGSTAQVHPYLFTTSMAKLAEGKGAKILLGSVTGIDHSEDGVKSVTYENRKTRDLHTISATDVIIAAGAWTKIVFPRAPISALRAHSVVIRPTRPVSAYAVFTNIALPAGFDTPSKSRRSRSSVVSPEIYARPDDTVYACGEGDTIVPLPETTADVEVDLSRCQRIMDSVGSISNELRDGEVIIRQACYLPNVEASRSGPLIGLTGITGLLLAAGHTCWGIQNAPGTGKLMSEFVFEGKAKSANIGNLDPRKFL